MPFVKGQSGNPTGGKKVPKEIRELARKNTERAFKRICQLIDSDDERTALAASVYIIDRAYGKPNQSVEVSGETKTYVIAVPINNDMEGVSWETQFNPAQKTLSQ